MADILLANFSDPAFSWVLLTIAVAGLVRGFSGFGSGMIIAPVTAALYSPQLALMIIIIVDSLPVLPVVALAWRQADWRELLPVIAGYTLIVPLGLLLLKFGEPVALRWLIAVTIFLAVSVLWSGWRYRGPRGRVVSLGVGGFSGFLGGTAALPGPPAIIYWMASSLAAATIRANTLVYLFLTDLVTGTGLVIGGIFTLDGALKGAAVAPVYLLALVAGTRLFGFASEIIYRRIAFAIILAAAILSLPLLDGLLRG